MKSLLVSLGRMCLTALVLGSVVFIGLFFDKIGLISLPPGVREAVESLASPREITIRVPGIAGPRLASLVEGTPAAAGGGLPAIGGITRTVPTDIPTEAPPPTPTPIPTVAPESYRAITAARLKEYSAALDRWLADNDRLSQDNALAEDAGWQAAMQVDLVDLRSSGRALAQVDPAPQQYAEIDGWLKKTGLENDSLVDNYTLALAQRDPQMFLAAGKNFERIKEYLTQAAQRMLAEGWAFQ